LWPEPSAKTDVTEAEAADPVRAAAFLTGSIETVALGLLSARTANVTVVADASALNRDAVAATRSGDASALAVITSKGGSTTAPINEITPPSAAETIAEVQSAAAVTIARTITPQFIRSIFPLAAITASSRISPTKQ
jgi:hypothetical protein